MVVHVAADILKLDPDGKVADKFAEDADEVGMGLVLTSSLQVAWT